MSNANPTKHGVNEAHNTNVHVSFIHKAKLVLLLYFFTFLVPCCDVRYDYRVKTMFGSSLPPIVCGRLMSYLRCLCLFAYIGVQHILSCVFLGIVCPVLPVSLDCPFLIALSIFSNVYFLK
jgi:hypothetical protein